MDKTYSTDRINRGIDETDRTDDTDGTGEVDKAPHSADKQAVTKRGNQVRHAGRRERGV
jgi:hypothetical protein